MLLAHTVILALLAGCQNPFQVGLGDKVDLSDPSLRIGTLGDGSPIKNGDYVSGTISLNGSLSDDQGIESVRFSLDGGTTWQNATFNGPAQTWSTGDIDTATYADGEKDIVVRVTDLATPPKIREENLLLYFDNHAPVVVITDSQGYPDAASNQQITIRF